MLSLLDVFDKPAGKLRTPGNPSDTEQDLLRAMLLFAGAGLDSTVKQLLKDVLPDAIDTIDAAHGAFTDYLSNSMTKRTAGTDIIDTDFIAEAFASATPRVSLISKYVEHTVSGSLQSVDEFLKVAAIFSLEPKDLECDPHKLRTVFQARNHIAHEMDAEFNERRSRRQRARQDMVSKSNMLIEITGTFIKKVGDRLAAQ